MPRSVPPSAVGWEMHECLRFDMTKSHAAFCEGPRPMPFDQLRFPTDADVTADEAARFRAASPADRMRSIRSTLTAGAILIARSPQRAFLEAYRREQEELARKTISEFVTRHARSF